MSHPEQRKENSLTAPSDRDPARTYRPNQSAPPLTEPQVEAALEELNNTAYVRRFPDIERRYADPPVDLQKIGLFSFVPAKGATPNENGFYGFAKLRGNFSTATEANERAEWLVRNVDSYHQIYHTYVGRPFPLTVSSDYSKEVDRVDLRREMTKTISHDVKSKREKEQKDIEDIRRREQELMQRNKEILADPDYKEPVNPELELDEYITLRVKKAQLTWTYLETQKKQKEVEGILAHTRRQLEKMEEKNPENKNKYFDKYMAARDQAGLDTAKHQDNFIKFMVTDVDLPAVNEEYDRLYNSNTPSPEEKKQ